MTHEEFDMKLLTIKLPFRVSEAARYILVQGISIKTAIVICNIESSSDLDKLNIALVEFKSGG